MSKIQQNRGGRGRGGGGGDAVRLEPDDKPRQVKRVLKKEQLFIPHSNESKWRVSSIWGAYEFLGGKGRGGIRDSDRGRHRGQGVVGGDVRGQYRGWVRSACSRL